MWGHGDREASGPPTRRALDIADGTADSRPTPEIRVGVHLEVRRGVSISPRFVCMFS